MPNTSSGRRKKNRTMTNMQFDTTSISGIRKTNDLMLRSLIAGKIDGRTIGAANGVISNQIRLIQEEKTAEELATTKKLLDETLETCKELTLCLGHDDLLFFSALTETLP